MGLVNLLVNETTYYWNQPGVTTTPAVNTEVDKLPPEALAALGVVVIVAIILAVFCLIAKYKLFQKMGMDGYKGLIPMVETYLTMEKIDVSPKWLLVITFGSCIAVIPCIGYLVFLIALIYYSIIYSISLARAFGKSDGFGVGLLLLNPIFLMILAFGDSKYVGPNSMEDKIFGKKSTPTVE